MPEIRNYAVISTTTNIVVNVIAWDGETAFDPGPEFILVQSDTANIGWTYVDGEFTQPSVGQPSNTELALAARTTRDQFLRSTYDPGILMAQRALRMAVTPEEAAYAEGKISELDAYAELLVAIPDQPGFPQTITWPVAPTK